MMTYEEVIAYHDELLTKNLKLMFADSQTDTDNPMLLDVITYNTLKHAGMLYRYTADDELFSIFSEESVVSIVELAYDYIKDMTIVESLENIIGEDILTDYDLENVDGLLYFRDGLEMVLFMLIRLAKPLVYEGNSDLLDILAKARSYALTFDEILNKRPDIYTVASRAGAYVQEYFKIELDKADFWWFYEAREEDEKYSEFEVELTRLINVKILKEKMAEVFKSVVESLKKPSILAPDLNIELNPVTLVAASEISMDLAEISGIKCEFSIDNDPEHFLVLKSSTDREHLCLYVLNTDEKTLSYALDGKCFVFKVEGKEWTSIINDGRSEFGIIAEMSELLIEIKDDDSTIYGTLLPIMSKSKSLLDKLFLEYQTHEDESRDR